MSRYVLKALGQLQHAVSDGKVSSAVANAVVEAHRRIADQLDADAQKAEQGFYINGVHVHAAIASDGAVVVWCDTEDEPTPATLRVNVNDGGVFGYPEESA